MQPLTYLGKRVFLFLSLITITVVFAGCKATPSTPEMPNIGIPSESINTKIKIEAPKELNNFEIGSVITIQVTALSEDHVLFQPNLGVRLFYQKDDHWVETKDLGMLQPEGDFVFPKTKSYPGNTAVTTIFPDLSGINETVTLRVIIIGNLYVNGEATDKKTAAYVDVVLHPK